MVGISSTHAVAAQEKPNPYSSFYSSISNHTTRGISIGASNTETFGNHRHISIHITGGVDNAGTGASTSTGNYFANILMIVNGDSTSNGHGGTQNSSWGTASTQDAYMSMHSSQNLYILPSAWYNSSDGKDRTSTVIEFCNTSENGTSKQWFVKGTASQSDYYGGYAAPSSTSAGWFKGASFGNITSISFYPYTFNTYAYWNKDTQFVVYGWD